jgi:hypothetical protein
VAVAVHAKVKEALVYLEGLAEDGEVDDEVVVRVRPEPDGRPTVFDDLTVDTLRGATAVAGNALNGESSYDTNIAQSQNANALTVEAWASGSGSSFGRLDDDATAYLDRVAKEIAQWLAAFVAPATPPDRLDEQETTDGSEVTRRTGLILRRNNLFHGHLVDSKDMDDTYVVFHAAEYPRNLEEVKSTLAKAVEGAGTVEFTSQDWGYAYRNVIWSLGKRKLWNPVYSYNSALLPGEHPTWLLLKGSSLDPKVPSSETVGALTVEQDRMGTEVAGLNFFPGENVRSFWRFTPA